MIVALTHRVFAGPDMPLKPGKHLPQVFGTDTQGSLWNAAEQFNAREQLTTLIVDETPLTTCKVASIFPLDKLVARLLERKDENALAGGLDTLTLPEAAPTAPQISTAFPKMEIELSKEAKPDGSDVVV